jgi:intein-encoded DNA endonuclease-like protein
MSLVLPTQEELKELYWEEKLSQREIGDRYGLGDATISDLMMKHKIPVRSISARRRKRVMLTTTPNLAYILGVMKGDGYVSNAPKWRIYQIVLNNTSTELCNHFAEALRLIGLRSHFWLVQKAKGNSKDLFRVASASQEFVLWYKHLSFYELKKLLMKAEMAIPFLRRFYEAEGCYYAKTKTCSISNSNITLIHLVHFLLKRLRIANGLYHCKRLGRERIEYQIFMNAKESSNFLHIINPCIKIPLGVP